jgi:hypothetical protein
MIMRVFPGNHLKGKEEHNRILPRMSSVMLFGAFLLFLYQLDAPKKERSNFLLNASD